MIIYQGGNSYFMYVLIKELRVQNNNHCIALVYGLFPSGNDYRYMTIPIHFVNNKYNHIFDKMQNANLGPGCKIFLKVSMHDQKIYVNQFLFQGQMKFYADQKSNLPERNLYVGKITKIKQFQNGASCLHMPINERQTKWMSLMVYDDVISKEQLNRLQPVQLPDGTIHYQPVVILAGEEKDYNGYPQAKIIRCYNN